MLDQDLLELLSYVEKCRMRISTLKAESKAKEPPAMGTNIDSVASTVTNGKDNDKSKDRLCAPMRTTRTTRTHARTRTHAHAPRTHMHTYAHAPTCTHTATPLFEPDPAPL